MPKRLHQLLPEACSHTRWGKVLNDAVHLLGLHGRPQFIEPCGSDAIAKPLVLFMGGSADDRHKAVLNQVFKKYYGRYHAQQAIGYGTFHQVNTFIEYAKRWHMAGQKIILVGHSYGGYGVMAVTRQLVEQGISVECLITLDPVACSIAIRDVVLMNPNSAKQWQPSPLLKQWINVYVDYEFIEQHAKKIGLPNIIALKGGPLRACEYASTNIKLATDLLGESKYLVNAHQWADVMFYALGLDKVLNLILATTDEK